MSIDKMNQSLKNLLMFSLPADKTTDIKKNKTIMKLIQGILSCALAAGLMTFAAEQAQAQTGVVIGNTLYSPLKIKVAIGVYNGKGAIKKVRVTSKEVLKMFGYKHSDRLVIDTGSINNNNDIYVISKNGAMENLTAEGYLTANLDELLDSSSNGKYGSFKYASSGILSLYFYSNPKFYSIGSEFAPAISNSNINQAESQGASDYWFEISGVYNYGEKGSVVNHNKQTIGTKLNAAALSGVGHDVDLNDPLPTTVKGSAAAAGEGKIQLETIE